MGLGEGAELRSPMAVAMLGGTISSTALTLVVIPMFYIFLTRLTEKIFGETFEDEDDSDDIESEIASSPQS